ncbi:MAG: ATP-dependent DNA ligase [Pirellula sp.]|jgi:DNA ligase-1|nr:ATP-dependent DNA ligase [Pirellula sp.]
MKEFSSLYKAIDETTKTNSKLAAMQAYFQTACHDDAAWAIFFLSGERFKRLINTRVLREWAMQSSQTSSWLFEESYSWVGDLAETVFLLVPSRATTTEGGLAFWVKERIEPLRTVAPDRVHDELMTCWQSIGPSERFLFLKLVTGGLRVGVSKRLVIRAIANAFQLPTELVAHRLTGTWLPTGESFRALISNQIESQLPSQPYPFCLANPIDVESHGIGEANDFLAEWKWDGIRSQLIKRGDQLYVWTRGEERVEDRYPDICQIARQLPDGTVLDGEILAWRNDKPLPFTDLQKRLGRKTVSPKLMRDIPVVFMAYDLLEYRGRDIRSEPLSLRRKWLAEVLNQAEIRLSEPVAIPEQSDAPNWEQLARLRETSRSHGAEGLMLKKWDSPYQVGRVRGAWWKWKIEPLTIDAVLVYAQKGHGKRSSLFTDYTFALWDRDGLVPFAKAYSGLSDSEIREVDAIIKANVKEKFGPVRGVAPILVMELAFENIQLSSRHKSGFAVRFPRILRWRKDKLARDANSLDDLRVLVQAHGMPSQS